MKKNIIGTYVSEEAAVGAIKGLLEKGYRPGEISIVAKDEEKLDHVADETHVNEEKITDDDMDSATFGTIAGFLTGIGGGIAVPGLGVPGVGPLLAAGPFASIFNDGGYDIREALINLDVSEEDADQYMKDLNDGKILVMAEPK